MSNGKFFTSTIAAAVALFLMGGLTWGIATVGFYEAHVVATELDYETPIWLMLILAELVWGAFLTVVLGKWIGIRTAMEGAKAAAIVGLYVGFAFTLTAYSMSSKLDLTITLVEPLLLMVNFAVAGAVIGLILGKGAADA